MSHNWSSRNPIQAEDVFTTPFAYASSILVLERNSGQGEVRFHKQGLETSRRSKTISPECVERIRAIIAANDPDAR